MFLGFCFFVCLLFVGFRLVRFVGRCGGFFVYLVGWFGFLIFFCEVFFLNLEIKAGFSLEISYACRDALLWFFSEVWC